MGAPTALAADFDGAVFIHRVSHAPMLTIPPVVRLASQAVDWAVRLAPVLALVLLMLGGGLLRRRRQRRAPAATT